MLKKAIACLLILVMGVSVMWFANPLAPAFVASAEAFQSGFSVDPEKEDGTGVLLDSGFYVKSQNKLSLEVLKASLCFRDGTPFTLSVLKDGRFYVKPSQNLKQNQVYFIDIKTQDGRLASFAFQTKRDFVVLGSLPDKMSTGVPVDTGIELYFSYSDVQGLEKSFEISPKVEGRFEYHGYAAVFIPKKLVAGTLYTVTVKKGLTAAKGAVSLKEDYTFAFETSPDPKSTASPSYGSLYLNSTWMEFGTGEKPVIPFDIYLSHNPSSVDVTMTVYQFKTLDDFLKAIRQKEKAPLWAPCAQSKNQIDTSGLTKVSEFKQGFNLQQWQQRYMMAPEALKDGFYLVELSSDKLTAQAFMQVSDVSSYSVSDKTNTLFWLNDLKTGTTIKDASILDLNSNQSATTDASGLAKLARTPKTGHGENMTQDFFKVTTADGKVSLINTGYSYDDNLPYTRYSFNEGAYWRYMQTDRTLYKPSD
ncbi:MAG: Ig-like domain-containing protein, partial [Clostridia bacterium]|nr:Ig-like domain-containing protein [Clostridia bacterium]